MKTGGEAELLSFLRAIDARLDADGFAGRVDLYVFGGAAVVIAYGSKRATVDIDALVIDGGLRKKLEEWAGRGSALASEHGLYFQGANTTLMPIVEPDWMERSVEIFKGGLKHFRVMAIGKEDLILTKLDRYNDRDREDIQFLAEAHREADRLLQDGQEPLRRAPGDAGPDVQHRARRAFRPRAGEFRLSQSLVLGPGAWVFCPVVPGGKGEFRSN